jgi:hypothetical protein
VPAWTVRTDARLDDSVRASVESAIALQGGTVAWREDAESKRTYGLIELPQDAATVRAALQSSIIVFDTAIIALAVSPTVPEALPVLLEAFSGAGRPDGILSCEASNGRLFVEWNPGRTSPELIYALIDAELRRFASGRTAELIAPLPEGVLAQIAAAGLTTPEIASNRVLETLIERMGIA